jgi:integral membrane protein (TIGR00529 family)
MILLKLVVALFVVITLSNKKVNLGIALTIGAILVGLMAGKTPVWLATKILESASSPFALELALIIVMITILGHAMKELDILQRMVVGFEGVLRSSKLTILIIPAIMGSFAVTGGALISCPIVDELGEKLSISKDKRATINLIYRHIFGMFIFPFSASFIMASRLANISAGSFIMMFMPITVFMLVAGYFLFLKGIKEPDKRKFKWVHYGQSVRELLLYAAPIYISLVMALALRIPFYVALVAGIVLTMIIFKIAVEKTPLYKERGGKSYEFADFLKLAWKGINPGMVLAVMGIMVFKGVLEGIEEIPEVLQALMDAGIPIEVVIIVFGWLMAFASSSTQGTIALLYPIILPLAETETIKELYVMLIYMSGFMGYYVSPLHMCQVLTLQYFNVESKALYKNYRIILPGAMAIAILMYIIKRGLI